MKIWNLEKSTRIFVHQRCVEKRHKIKKKGLPHFFSLHVHANCFRQLFGWMHKTSVRVSVSDAQYGLVCKLYPSWLNQCTNAATAKDSRDGHGHAHARYISTTTKPLPNSATNSDYDTLTLSLSRYFILKANQINLSQSVTWPLIEAKQRNDKSHAPPTATVTDKSRGMS